nr:hypothetical protein GCM10020241_36910 [Streptoalloteichus tenebrarius]
MGDDRVKGFYASLHLNMGKAYQDLGEPGKAHEHFALAARHVDAVPPGQYGDWVRFAIAEGLRENGQHEPHPVEEPLSGLLARLCARADLRALGLILPAYLGNLGTDEDLVRLATALRMVHASRWLPEDEQETLGAAIACLPDLRPAPTA